MSASVLPYVRFALSYVLFRAGQKGGEVCGVLFVVWHVAWLSRLCGGWTAGLFAEYPFVHGLAQRTRTVIAAVFPVHCAH